MANGLSVIGIMLLLCSYESQLITAEASSVHVTIRGANVSENGYIDFDSIGSTNGEAVLCHTNDPTCCAKGQDNPGDWYFPDGSMVESYTNNIERGDFFFARNRGINPPVVRLYHVQRNTLVVAQERGRFHCEIRDAAGNLQQLHVNVLDVGDVALSIHDLSNVIANERCELTLECSVNISPYPLPANVPYPNFEWFFGPTNSSLPSGATLSDVRNTRNNYISTLQFSPLLPHHFGMYTCRLGRNERLAANTFIPVSSEPPQAMPRSFTAVPDISMVHFFWISPSSGVTVCGYSLTCTPMVLGLDDLTMTYTEAGTHIYTYTLMGFRPVTEYRCRVLAFNSAGYGPPAEINLTTVDETSYIKFCLVGDIEDCSLWTANNSTYLEEIANILVDNIQAHCRCGFTRDRITNGTFNCTPQAVIYSVIIHGTATSTSPQLISYIEKWIAEETAAFTLHQIHLSLEASCTMQNTVTKFLTFPEATTPQKDQNQILLFGTITSGLAAFILAGAVIVLVILLVRKKHHAQSYIVDNDVYDRINRYPLSTTGCSVHKQTKLNVPVYENIQLGNANECKSEKIKFSRCPAYEDTLTRETFH